MRKRLLYYVINVSFQPLAYPLKCVLNAVYVMIYWCFKSEPAGDSDDKEEEEAEDVDGCIRDDDDAGDGGVDLAHSGFALDAADGNFNGKYLALSWEVLGSLWSPTSLLIPVGFRLLRVVGVTPPSSEVSEPVELEHFWSFSFMISSLTTLLYLLKAYNMLDVGITIMI